MGATGVTVSETSKRMWDSSGEISDRVCVPVYGAAEYDVYMGTGWSAMRYVSMQEPGDDPPHFAEQAVVAFPNGDDAAKFFADSEENWAGVPTADTRSSCPITTSTPRGRWGRCRPPTGYSRPR